MSFTHRFCGLPTFLFPCGPVDFVLSEPILVYIIDVNNLLVNTLDDRLIGNQRFSVGLLFNIAILCPNFAFALVLCLCLELNEICVSVAQLVVSLPLLMLRSLYHRALGSFLASVF